jgi:hypothetical protein
MKIAFCFLSYHTIIRYDIWNKFFENIDHDKYCVYIHPKDKNNIDVSNFHFQYFICDNIIQTVAKYDISIVKATLKLLEYAYINDNHITHFIFLSQSCIPLYNFDKIYNLLKLVDLSIVSYIQDNKKERYYQLTNIIKKYIKYSSFVKQQPNMILIRNDVRDLINKDYTLYFKNMTCPDEHYFINVLLYLLKKNIIKKQINFCNPDLNKTQALEYNLIDKNFIKQLRSYGFLFMRKVNKNSIIDMDYITCVS